MTAPADLLQSTCREEARGTQHDTEELSAIMGGEEEKLYMSAPTSPPTAAGRSDDHVTYIHVAVHKVNSSTIYVLGFNYSLQVQALQ